MYYKIYTKGIFMSENNSSPVTKNEKTEKSIKSVNLSKKNIERVTNYIQSTGGTFSDVTDKGLDLFFEALEKGNNKLIDGIGLDDPDNTLLVPLSLYIKMKNTSFTQVNKMIQRNELRLISLTDNDGNESSRFKYISVTDAHPDYYLSKITMMGESLASLEKRIETVKEETVRLMQEKFKKFEEEKLKKRVLEIPCQSDKIISRIEHGREI
jgi:hypothetical protein